MLTPVQSVSISDFSHSRARWNKLRGGYYTPKEITDFIAEWVVRDTRARCLEPSCGDGAFVESLARRYQSLGASPEQIHSHITGVELYPQEAEKAGRYGAHIINGDFFSFYQTKIWHRHTFNAVVGNPPFIRYQNFEESLRKRAFSMVRETGIALNRLTNIWIPFLILSSECLSADGRLGMVIPAELFQVDYAAETRAYLARKFEHLTVITFQKLLFDSAQQEVVLLLGEISSPRKGIEIYELNDVEDLHTFSTGGRPEVKNMDFNTDKWIKYYLSNRELSLLKHVEALNGVTPTTDLFDANVGLVSGQNRFFLMDSATAEQHHLSDAVRPVIGRAEQLSGIRLDASDFARLAAHQKKVFLFTPEDVEKSALETAQREYVEYGEGQGYHRGFKCRNRKHWYIVPQSWSPEAFMLRQIHRCPRIVLNKTPATNTDTLHKIRFHPGINPENVASAFLNSFTFAQCEVTGRSYGGGVMTFEPGEVRKLRIPMKSSQRIDFCQVDGLIRRGKWEEALNYVDSIVLSDGLGLSRSDVLMLRDIWKKLSGRRLGRKEGHASAPGLEK